MAKETVLQRRSFRAGCSTLQGKISPVRAQHMSVKSQSIWWKTEKSRSKDWDQESPSKLKHEAPWPMLWP